MTAAAKTNTKYELDIKRHLGQDPYYFPVRRLDSDRVELHDKLETESKDLAVRRGEARKVVRNQGG